MIWKDQPWLDYRFPATDEVDGYPTYLVPIFTVFPAIFFALQPLLYLGGARPLGWLGRGCLWGSTLLGIVMVGLIYVISDSSSFSTRISLPCAVMLYESPQ